jgi:hypothetical protein
MQWNHCLTRFRQRCAIAQELVRNHKLCALFGEANRSHNGIRRLEAERILNLSLCQLFEPSGERIALQRLLERNVLEDRSRWSNLNRSRLRDCVFAQLATEEARPSFFVREHNHHNRYANKSDYDD